MFDNIRTQQTLTEILTKLGQIDTKLADMNKFIKNSEKTVKTQNTKSSGISQ